MSCAMPELLACDVSRHAWRHDCGKLSGLSAGQYGHARVVGELDALAGRNYDSKWVSAWRRDHERSRRDIAHLTAPNDRVGGIRAHADDGGKDRGGEKHGEQAHVNISEQAPCR